MSTLFSPPKPSPNLRRNVFDLSELSLYSMSAGMLLPVVVKEVNPDEKFKLSVNSFSRTMPLNTAAFVRMKQYFHWFFVPYEQLWSGWPNFINGVDYKVSSLQSNAFAGSANAYKQVPSINLFSAIYKLIKANKFDIIGKYASDVSANTLKASARDEHGYSYIIGFSRMLDMLGYGFSSTGFDGIGEACTFQELFNSLFEKYRSNGVPQMQAIEASLAKMAKLTMHVNPFRLLAYQKIYNDFYKNDDYEATNPLFFNIDDFDGTKTIDSVADAERLLGMFRLRYRWLPKDYFTGVVPSELGGLSNALGGMAHGDFASLSPDAMVKNDSIGLSTLGLSTKSIRAAFALENLMRKTRRAGGFDYASQIKAHYGVSVPEGRTGDVRFLGGFSSPIKINEVITQADTEISAAGRVAGAGYGFSDDNKPISFTSKEHGLLMCVSSIVPDLNYSAVGLEKNNAKFFRGDYFHPEFQDLGYQPVFGFELLNWYNNFAQTLPDPSKGSAFETGGNNLNKLSKSTILGFVPRYSEYKVSYDRLHGEFRNGRTMSMWSANSMLGFVGGVVPSTLKINPSCLDRIFAKDFDGTEATDQFMVQSQFIIKAIRPMSVIGQTAL